jgi:hypothetical protein
MLVFHELVYEGYVLADSAIVVPGAHLMALLGGVDVLHLSGYAVQVTGTSPTLTIAVEVSNDRIFWWPQNLVSPVINGLSLTIGSETFFQGVDSSPTATRFAYAKLNIGIGGTNARGFVRVWATGRDQSRRSAVSSRAVNGGTAQMEMARRMSKVSKGMGLYGPKA